MQLRNSFIVVSEMNVRIKPTIAVLVAFFMMSSMLIGTSWNSSNISALTLNNHSHISFVSSVIIDGTLSVDEWSDAQHIVEWYMDADPANSDGYNYMYIDEDPYNLYIALDLCSDQTNDSNGEWVGLWLNTNESASSSSPDWESALNNGMESILHDVDNDEIFEYFQEGTSFQRHGLQLDDEFIAVDGILDGDPSDLESNNDVYLNVTSEYNGSHYVYRLDIDVDLREFFYIFKDLHAEHVWELGLQMFSHHNVSIDEHFLSISDNLGNLNPNIKVPLTTGTTDLQDLEIIGRENFTSDYNVRLSLNGVNDAPFNTSFDYMTLYGDRNATTVLGGGSALPYASIRNYDIAWSFGPSENNATDHRSFEIKIPKSELEKYEMDTDLGIIVGGYGTLSAWPNTHHWVYASTEVTGIPETDSSEYNNFTMLMKGWSPPIPALASISPNPDPDGNVTIDWNDDAEAINWTLYRHSGEITELNLNSATVLASGLTTSQHEDTGLSDGTYWYAVVAFDEFGYTHLSNSLSVTVEFPTTTTPTTPTTTPPPIDLQLLLIIGGAGAVVLLIVVIVLVRKR